MLHLRLVDDDVKSGLSTDIHTPCSVQHSLNMGKAVFLDTVNRLVVDFWIYSVERGRYNLDFSSLAVKATLARLCMRSLFCCGWPCLRWSFEFDLGT